jgi:dUTP pyrophosphatase
MKIYVKKIDGLRLPEKKSDVSAGYDIIATSDPKIVGEPIGNKWKRIDYIEYETNLYIAPSTVNFHTLIHPRSSISKYNLVLANSIGLIDNDYRGVVICRFKYQWQPEDLIMQCKTGNFTDEYCRPTGELVGKYNLDKIYSKGDAIAQLVAESTTQIEWELVDDLDQTKRGTGGFGSTDKKLGFDPNPNTKINSDSKILNKPSLIDMYKKLGGVAVKEKYTEEVKSQIQEI